jgi:putative transposase
MYRSEIHIIKPTHWLFKYCDEMCFKSKNLYNYANYLIRQEFINTNKYIPPNDLNKELKTHEAFKALPAKTLQQIIIGLDFNWRSFFRSVKIWAKNKSRFCGKPSLPKYKQKDGRNIVYFDYMQGSFKPGKYYFPNQKEFYIDTLIMKNDFKKCTIIPCGNCYKISIIYKVKDIKPVEQNSNYLSIDLGVNNIATLTNNAGLQPVIINGKIVKSINNYFNKLYAKAQSYAPKLSTKRTGRLALKRSNILDTHMHKISKWIINYCVSNDIGNIVIGARFDWKRNVNIGAKNNQKFVQIPYEQLIKKIQYKAEEQGIRVTVIDEKYTSKASFIDDDPLPEEFGNYSFSGNRIKRGLYKTKEGLLINSDVNGSYNILRKRNPEFKYEDRIKAVSLQPVRLSIV